MPVFRVDVSSDTAVGVCGQCSWRTLGETRQEVLKAGHRHARTIHGPKAGDAVYMQMYEQRRRRRG